MEKTHKINFIFQIIASIIMYIATVTGSIILGVVITIVYALSTIIWIASNFISKESKKDDWLYIVPIILYTTSVYLLTQSINSQLLLFLFTIEIFIVFKKKILRKRICKKNMERKKIEKDKTIPLPKELKKEILETLHIILQVDKKISHNDKYYSKEIKIYYKSLVLDDIIKIIETYSAMHEKERLPYKEAVQSMMKRIREKGSCILKEV